jgi:hypothetical protein
MAPPAVTVAELRSQYERDRRVGSTATHIEKALRAVGWERMRSEAGVKEIASFAEQLFDACVNAHQNVDTLLADLTRLLVDARPMLAEKTKQKRCTILAARTLTAYVH